MANENDTEFIPNPSIGEASPKQRLFKLAQEHSVLRISAEKGLEVDEAISVIEAYSKHVERAAFPVAKFAQLV